MAEWDRTRRLQQMLEELEARSSQASSPKSRRGKGLSSLTSQYPSNQPSKKTSARAPRSPSANWIPPGQSITIKNHVISDGMIYVGQDLKSSHLPKQIDPCLINPKLNVSHHPHRGEYGLRYQPSYRQISADCRATYLEWLAEGRRTKGVPIGCVFLFFYGLERRVLTDYLTLRKKEDVAIPEEIDQIIAEVEALLDTYSYMGGFGNYASKFLRTCRLLKSPESLADFEPDSKKKGWELPLEFKVVLGRKVAAKKPIPLNWIWCWYIYSDRVRLSMAAHRCETELQALLKLYYQRKYGEGMVVKPNKRKLEVHYHPASSGFLKSIAIDIGDVPDVTRLSSPLNRFQTLIDECIAVLEPYGRWLGRNSEQRDPKAALALLPLEALDVLQEQEVEDYGDRLRRWLLKALGSRERVVLEGEQLIKCWDPMLVLADRQKPITKSMTMLLVQGLGKVGFGIEPDVRFLGKPLKGDSTVVLFPLTAPLESVPTQIELSREYKTMLVLLQLAAMVAGSVAIAQGGQKYLNAYLDAALQLSKDEQARLKAHFTWMLHQKPTLRGMKPKLSAITNDKKRDMAEVLIGVAGAEGAISSPTVATLVKIYPLLGFEKDEVYSHVHQFSTSAANRAKRGPVTVRSASKTSSGFAIPNPAMGGDRLSKSTKLSDKNAPHRPGLTLDLDAIQKKEAESKAVTNLLGELFEEEDAEAIAVNSTIISVVDGDTNGAGEGAIAGLDSLHSQFLRILSRQETWSRQVLETQAGQLGLMLDGALEIINDMAFEMCDDPLTDGEDPISIDTDILGELLP